MPNPLMHCIAFILAALVVACNAKNTNLHDVRLSKVVHWHSAAHDQSSELTAILDRHDQLILVLDSGALYQIGGVIAERLTSLEIAGNNASFVATSPQTRSILTLVDFGTINITDLTMNGNFPTISTEDYLLKIHTPSNVTKNVSLDGVSFKDGGAGGLIIQNIYADGRPLDYATGADYISVRNCTFHNVGLYAGVNIRGSHKEVVIDRCEGTDSLSRQHFAYGKMFEVSAEVGLSQDRLNNVRISNCVVHDANKAFFAQQVKSLRFTNNRARHLGWNPVKYPDGRKVGIVALKLDDLGEGSDVLVDSFYVSETADLDYKYMVSVEESGGTNGISAGVQIKNFDTDVGIRLVGTGRNSVSNGVLRQAPILLQSPSNTVSNVIFDGTPHHPVALKVLSESNTIKDCKFYSAQIVIYKQAQKTKVVKCSRFNSDPPNFIVVDYNIPADPISLFIEDISMASGVELLWSGGIPAQSAGMKIELGKSLEVDMLSNQLVRHASVTKVRRSSW